KVIARGGDVSSEELGGALAELLVGVAGVEGDGVDHRVEAFVVGAQGVEDLPHGLEPLVVCQGLGGWGVSGDGDGKDDVAVVLAGGFAHDAADGLDDVDYGVAGVKEQHRIQRGDVNAFGQAAGIGQDATLVVGDGR